MMRTLEETLVQYAACHRDRRNIATHFLGIPLAVFSIVLALALVDFPAGGVTVTLAAIASVGASAYYVKLDPAFGAFIATALFLMCALASEVVARAPAPATLAGAVALFAAGWALQAWGHRLEGFTPAFRVDAAQRLAGPLFLCAQVFFFLGAKPELHRRIVQQAGPTVARRGGANMTGAR